MKKALIAMSGGVDSSVAALLMKKEGYDCIGVTMKLHDNGEFDLDAENSCCSTDDIEDAKRVAENLEMPHYVKNFMADFKCRIIYQFVETYLDGRTPNPCVQCNKEMKFGDLLKAADELGCEKIVTGHYVRVEFDEKTGYYRLRKAVDESKDQTYVLYFLDQKTLSRIAFPLGDLQKKDARELAESAGFINANKQDSQDICFVPDGDYIKIIERFACELCGGTGRPIPEAGDFVLMDGTVIGHHKGIHHYTIGQRKGLGIAYKEPLYVVSFDLENNRIILGSNDDLFSRNVHADDFSMVCPAEVPLETPISVSAKIRYRHKEQPGTLVVHKDGTADMTFDEPQRAVTKGQSLVVYQGEYVLGGGIIN